MAMNPCISTAIWLGLTSTRQATPYPDILPEVLPPLRRPIQQQTRLGWEQLYQGRVATGWAQAIDKIHPELQLTGEQVMTHLSKIIWKFILETWKTRNNHLHQNAGDLNLPNYRQAAINLYDQRHLIPPDAQEALYRLPLEKILEQPAPRLQQWTKRGLAYFNQQLQAAKIQAKINTPDIRTFFGPKTQLPHDHQPP